jgi:hypothetical protein
MKKTLLTGIAALFLATGIVSAAQANESGFSKGGWSKEARIAQRFFQCGNNVSVTVNFYLHGATEYDIAGLSSEAVNLFQSGDLRFPLNLLFMNGSVCHQLFKEVR